MDITKLFTLKYRMSISSTTTATHINKQMKNRRVGNTISISKVFSDQNINIDIMTQPWEECQSGMQPGREGEPIKTLFNFVNKDAGVIKSFKLFIKPNSPQERKVQFWLNLFNTTVNAVQWIQNKTTEPTKVLFVD